MKICICGSPWSGKSHLAWKLENVYNIPIFHLDEIFINDDWTKKENTEKLQEEIFDTNKQRIIDWNYWDNMISRLERSDKIYILNIPRIICVYRIIKRYILELWDGSHRIWVWNKRPVISRSFLKFVRNYKKTTWYSILQSYTKAHRSKVIEISRKEQVSWYKKIELI